MLAPALDAAAVRSGQGALAGVHRSVLLTGFRTDPPALVAVAVLLAVAVVYLVAVRRLARRGRRWPLRRSASFLAGVFFVWVAVGSGLAAYDESNVTLHVVQHWLLMMIAPPLLSLGQPLLLGAQSAGRTNQVRLTRLLRGRSFGALTHPVLTWCLYIGVMYLIFLDRSVYDYLVTHQTAHEASHLALLAVGLLYWHPFIGVASARRRLPDPVRILAVMLAMPFEGFLGVWLQISTRPIDPINTLVDTRTAGQLFLALATLSCALWTLVVAAQWYAGVVREDRRVTARSEAAGWTWTVPWWEQPAPQADGAPAGAEITAS